MSLTTLPPTSSLQPPAFIRPFSLIVTLIALWSSTVQACEGCKMAAVNASSGGTVESQTVMAGIALSWSVLFMLFVVFLLLGVLAWSIRSACQQADAVHLTLLKKHSSS